MRIIAGDLRGRKLITPKDSRVRPTTDKVKEAIFNMIAPYLEDAVILDLFAGTGNLGLESISRGAKFCYFGDRSKESLELIKENIAHCKVELQTKVLQGEFERILNKIPEKAQVIFLDPPYGTGFIEKSLKLIAEKELLAQDGIIVAEHGAREQIDGQSLGFYTIKEKKYGTIVITVFTQAAEDVEE